MIRLLLLVVLSLAMGCADREKTPDPGGDPVTTPSAPTVDPGEALRAPWSVSYSDGSGNSYAFTRQEESGEVRFEFLPVTPKESSSGIYSGGEPRSGRMSASDVGELERWLQRLEMDTSIHTELRSMGTGRFDLVTPAGERSFVVTKCATLDRFGAFAQALPGE